MLGTVDVAVLFLWQCGRKPNDKTAGICLAICHIAKNHFKALFRHFHLKRICLSFDERYWFKWREMGHIGAYPPSVIPLPQWWVGFEAKRGGQLLPKIFSQKIDFFWLTPPSFLHILPFLHIISLTQRMTPRLRKVAFSLGTFSYP